MPLGVSNLEWSFNKNITTHVGISRDEYMPDFTVAAYNTL